MARGRGGMVAMDTRTENQKRTAAKEAAKEVKDHMILGLGTGSTVRYLISELARLAEMGLSFQAVATSEKTEIMARQRGLSLLPVGKAPKIHLAIDGVDAIDEDFFAVKGGGGALFREKVIASRASRVIWIMDERKTVHHLSCVPLPVEIVPFGFLYVKEEIETLGFTTTLRRTENGGQPYVTDNGNYILDLEGNPAMDYPDLANKIKAMAGVVETGLFPNFCEKIIIGTDEGCIIRRNPGSYRDECFSSQFIATET